MSVREHPPSRSDPRDEGADEPTILGFPVEDDEATGAARAPADVRLVVLRRGDPLAAAALVIAGVATTVSLWVPWLRGEPAIGFALVQRGLQRAGSDIDGLLAEGQWPPLAVVLGGGLLLLLGLLLFRPARTHRLVGVLELFVAVLAAAGVLVLLADAGWRTARFDVGAWCAVAVAVFGLLGALKAVLTTPRVVLEPQPPLPR